MKVWPLVVRAHGFLRARFPRVYRVLEPLRDRFVELEPASWKFSRIHQSKGFGGQESVSGSGSSLASTEAIRGALPSLLRELEVRRLLDAPCGDWNWMRHVDLEGIDYCGVDIVPGLIEENRSRYAGPAVRFLRRDILRDALPEADLILSRDCFIHLSDRQILTALANFESSGARFLLTSSYSKIERNEDLGSRRFRAVNLELPPFDFPPPLRCLPDHSPGLFLGLWTLADLSRSVAQPAPRGGSEPQPVE